MNDTSTDDTDRNPHTNYPSNPTKDPDIPDTRNWHETGTLPCGYRVGKLGALWYVLDEDEWAVSDGYHEISDDGSEGKKGASTERVNLRGQPARYTMESEQEKST